MKFSRKWIWVLVLGAAVLFFFFRRSNPAAANASLNVGKTESRNSMSSSTTSSSSDNFAFSARHVLFLTNRNPHPLSQKIEILVAQGLKDFPLIEKLEMAPATSAATEAPDLFLRVDSSSIKEDGVLSRTLKATITTSLGRSPWQSRHFVQSRSTPPIIQFDWNAQLKHESTFSGVRTDRYKEAARAIADQLLKGITNQLQELSTKHSTMPELPHEFYGPYQPVSDFAFLEEINAQRICSYHGLFTHNETFWRFQTATNPVPELHRIAEQLKAEGWKLDDSNLTNTLDYYQRFVREDVVVEIFHEERERLNLGATEIKGTALDFIVHYKKVFSDAERETALEKLFVENVPLETLLPFQNSFSSRQTERYYAVLEKSPAVSPRSYVLLAEHYWRHHDTNAAVKMLLRAKAFRASDDSSASDSRIDDLAKKISPKEKLKLDVTPRLYREFGFLEITNAPQTFELERAFGQPVLLFAEGKRGPQTFCLTVQPPQKRRFPWSMIQSEGYGRSSQSSHFTLPANSGTWQQSFTFGDRSFNFVATLLPDKKGFKYRVVAYLVP